eukprot:scaffold57052_cov45-Phaeocystis_antarctica.AAC.1
MQGVTKLSVVGCMFLALACGRAGLCAGRKRACQDRRWVLILGGVRARASVWSERTAGSPRVDFST